MRILWTMNRPSILTGAALPVFAILLLGRAVSTQPQNQSAAALKNPVGPTLFNGLLGLVSNATV